MSGQWEVVGKKRDKNSVQQAQKSGNNKENKQKIVVKVEDILPRSQIINLFGNNKGSIKDSQKVQEKSKKNETTNQQKKQKKQPQPVEKSDVQPKPKPKSIESALNSISIDELKKVYEQNKTLFPDGPIVWLKELQQFLNRNIPVEISDPIFQNKSDCYPFSVIPAQIKAIMEKACKEADSKNQELFFDICLSSMAMEMTNGFSAIGQKLFLQLLALNNPKIVIANISKSISLRTSYQNRQNVGLSILWALGMGGLKDLNVGFKVFQEIMFPLIEMKNYSRFICGYLIDLINRFNDVPLSKEQYQFVMEYIYSNKKNSPLDLSAQIQKQKLKELLFINSKDKYHGFVEFFLKKLTIRDSDSYRNELCDVIIACLIRDPTTFNVWTKHYSKNLVGSAILLNYIDANWTRFRKNFGRKVLNDVLISFSVTNEDLMTKKKKDEGLIDAMDEIEKIRGKMARKKTSGFPYKALIFLTVFVSGVIVVYDIRRNGNKWERSTTYNTLKQWKVDEYLNVAGDKVIEGANWAHGKFQEKFPGYTEKAVEYSEPYLELTKEFGKFFCNACAGLKELIVEKYPIFVESIETYAPGLIEQSSKTMENVWSTSVLYFNRSVDYLKQEVFVGQLAPENVQKLVIEALNTTQQKASEYYYWLYEKVQSTIK
ncbi:transmembrane protein 214-B [Onthophagus taurus]|uniref:transmembrane protein 214-B n=1 Tax=Onthophagus taurus TaxID=166361 RepID=UPI0039BE5E14